MFLCIVISRRRRKPQITLFQILGSQSLLLLQSRWCQRVELLSACRVRIAWFIFSYSWRGNQQRISLKTGWVRKILFRFQLGLMWHFMRHIGGLHSDLGIMVKLCVWSCFPKFWKCVRTVVCTGFPWHWFNTFVVHKIIKSLGLNQESITQS